MMLWPKWADLTRLAVIRLDLRWNAQKQRMRGVWLVMLAPANTSCYPLGPMTADVFVFCERYSLDRATGQFSIFDILPSRAAVHLPIDPEVSLVWRIRFGYQEEGEHVLSIRIIGESGTVIQEHRVPYTATMDDRALNCYCHGGIALSISLPEFGLYSAELRCQNKLLATTFLRILSPSK